MRILVLGGDGYLGWPTALHLSAAGHEVAVADSPAPLRPRIGRDEPGVHCTAGATGVGLAGGVRLPNHDLRWGSDRPCLRERDDCRFLS